MGLVDEADEVLGEVVDQAVGPIAGDAAVEDARVVLDAGAEARSRAASPCRTACAGAGGGTPAACPRPPARRSAR